MQAGVSFCLLGLIMKVVVADNADLIANRAFGSAARSLGNTLAGT